MFLHFILVININYYFLQNMRTYSLIINVIFFGVSIIFYLKAKSKFYIITILFGHGNKIKGPDPSF